MPKILLRPRRCNACESIFCVCSHCERGQRYCSDLCRKQARQEQRRAANRRYQQTAVGREAHKLRQSAYRRRQCGPRVTDQGYRLVILGGSKRHSNFTRCAICGQPSEWVELYKRVRQRGPTRRERIPARRSTKKPRFLMRANTMLPSALSRSDSFRPVHAGRSRFSRCCHLISALWFCSCRVEPGPGH